MARTGPKTPQGRERSSQNAMKHGLTSNRMFVFDNESPEKWQALLEVWTRKLLPADDAEMCIVVDIAHAQWKLRRARTYESGLMDAEMEQQAEKLEAAYGEVDEGVRQASAFRALADNSRSLDLLHRYETRARRAFERGLATLEKLRSMTPPAAGIRNADDAPAVQASACSGLQPAPVESATYTSVDGGSRQHSGPSQLPQTGSAAPPDQILQNENTPPEYGVGQPERTTPAQSPCGVIYNGRTATHHPVLQYVHPNP